MAKILIIGPNFAQRKVARKLFKSEADVEAFQPRGSIVQVFGDDHRFSSTELEIYEVVEVQGFQKAEIKDFLKNKRFEIRRYELSGIEEWQDSEDGKWKRLANEPKLMFVADFSEQNKITLADAKATKTVKAAILENAIRNRIKDYSENLVVTK